MAELRARPALSLESELRYLKGVGPRGAELLAALGLQRVQDLLFHLPLRYEDRTRFAPLRELHDGRPALIACRIEGASIKFGRRRSLVVTVTDEVSFLLLRFFHFNAAQQEQLKPGAWLRCFGTARLGPQGLEMVHPEYRVLAHKAEATPDARLTPVYPTTTGIQQPRLRRLVEQALGMMARTPLPELLPTAASPGVNESLQYLHAPPPGTDLSQLENGRHPAQRRLALEELTAQQLAARARRRQMREQTARALAGDQTLRRAFHAELPFKLTRAQQRVIAEIERDLAQTTPMLRLLQGDVGSGKTVVAASAMLAAVECGAQAALMAPTELLAEQHARNLRRWLEPLKLPVGLLSGAQTAAERRRMLEALADGRIPVVVGTHALFQEEVRFKQLAICVIDEQHRFGVHQRLALRAKGGVRQPHQLVMTATPIPRTLAMALYADLDSSVIDELPPGRKPVQTVAMPDTRRAEVLKRVAAACAEGRQCYWVCTLIEESELLAAQAAEQTAEELRTRLPHLKIGLAHGRLRPAEKDAVMSSFRDDELQLLVATTVIEVGVDVPNASLMVIENSERLGLAQLHQLRGRVGRGAAQSHCVLLYHPPLGPLAQARLAVLRDTNDGFKIAQSDLELRGPGELLGTRQAGLVGFKIADLARDADLLPRAQQTADAILQTSPANVAPLLRRWLGDAEIYAHA
ncbi:MAG: ATP-dependent DNA helicase RecG [Nevskiales bacterium]